MYAAQDQVLFLCRMCRRGLHAVLLPHIGRLMRLLAAEPLAAEPLSRILNFISLSVSLWNDVSDPVFDDVRLAGFKSKVNAFLLA